jgi:glycosyltransferase involved in cell wall biosynthesis
VQTEEAARHLLPERVLGIDMGGLSTLPNDWGGFDPDRLTVRRLDRLDPDDVRRWLSGLDVAFGCETFYVPWFTGLARAEGVATVLQVNPEFAQHVYDWQPQPDVIANPSTWRMDRLPGAVHLPVGVARDRLPPRARTQLSTVLHVMGHGAAHDRNGTVALMEALRSVRRPVGVVVRSQRPLSLAGQAARLPSHVEVEVAAADVARYWDLYDEGDVLVLPRRYGGLCLVVQEALSTGMPALMPNVSPNGSLLPPSMLVPVERARPGRTFACQSGRLQLADADPAALAARIDELVDDPAQVRVLSAMADQVAERLAWPNVLPAYSAAFEAAVRCSAASR